MVDDVFVPLLSNEENYDDWPEIVAQDVQKQVHNLKSTVYQVKGQVNGETILAMPVGVDKIVKVAAELQETKKCTIDLYLKGAIEGVVIKWVIQVNDVYSETPSSAFNGGQNPLPNVGKQHLTRLKPLGDILMNNSISPQSFVSFISFVINIYFGQSSHFGTID